MDPRYYRQTIAASPCLTSMERLSGRKEKFGMVKRDNGLQYKELIETKNALERFKDYELKNKESGDAWLSLREHQNELMRKSMHVRCLGLDGDFKCLILLEVMHLVVVDVAIVKGRIETEPQLTRLLHHQLIIIMKDLSSEESSVQIRQRSGDEVPILHQIHDLQIEEMVVQQGE
ncbi:hypothetical protein GIB67_020932 [Kingdonia uniflora]|uniref:Uncharacterized protein n=1 Tax=Kingdonia uniflora TaxID=39325 RepID=A0A7J7M7J6_9MAGN|nr:hypothetical protein GIB67_020932 [Kingdonia uniflora]